LSPVTVYSSPFCPYCFMAKKLLKAKGVAFEEVDVLMHPARRREMVERAGGRATVPQIFIGDVHVGGYDDLAALEGDGRLDPLLGGAS
jgi:glutaredoxin 3